MDDFFEALIAGIVAFVVIFFAVTMIMEASSDDKHKDKSEDKRYSQCIEAGKDWYDGNCVGGK